MFKGTSSSQSDINGWLEPQTSSKNASVDLLFRLFRLLWDRIDLLESNDITGLSIIEVD
jgi:hypothetical protein